MGSLQIVLFPSNYLQMAIRRAGNIANIWHLPREFSPLVIAECSPPLQAEKTFFFHFVFRSPCCPVTVCFLLHVEIEFSAFFSSLLHVLTSNSCMSSLKTPGHSFGVRTGLLYGLHLLRYTDRLQIYPSESCNMFSFSQPFPQLPPFSSKPAANIVAAS